MNILTLPVRLAGSQPASGRQALNSQPSIMPMQSAVPILAFLDANESASFYKKIGFDCNDNWKEYLMCSRDKIEIHLWKCDDPAIPKNTGCYVRVDEIDTLLSLIHI